MFSLLHFETCLLLLTLFGLSHQTDMTHIGCRGFVYDYGWSNTIRPLDICLIEQNNNNNNNDIISYQYVCNPNQTGIEQWTYNSNECKGDFSKTIISTKMFDCNSPGLCIFIHGLT